MKNTIECNKKICYKGINNREPKLFRSNESIK